MLNNDEQNGFSYLLILIGIGIGIVAGLLIAPRPGAEIREDIQRRTNEGVDYLNQQVDKLREGAEQAVTKGKEWMGRQGDALSAVETKKPLHEQI
jgi:gas vesicle protein